MLLVTSNEMVVASLAPITGQRIKNLTLTLCFQTSCMLHSPGLEKYGYPYYQLRRSSQQSFILTALVSC